MTNWYNNLENVVELATWLADNEKFDTAAQVIAFLEKPWNWEPEWNQMQKEKAVKIEEIEN